MNYVTYDEAGNLTGAYIQDVLPQHQPTHIEVSPEIYDNWTAYRANAARNGVELAPLSQPSIADLKAAKNEKINSWRAAANLSTFPHAGKEIACDALSRSDIDGVANNIALSGGFPTEFPMAWKAVDNTFIQLADVNAFKAMYASMTTQGTENFKHAQALKAQLASAQTQADIDAIAW